MGNRKDNRIKYALDKIITKFGKLLCAGTEGKVSKICLDWPWEKLNNFGTRQIPGRNIYFLLLFLKNNLLTVNLYIMFIIF